MTIATAENQESILKQQVQRLEEELQEVQLKMEDQAAETERLTFENGALTQAYHAPNCRIQVLSVCDQCLSS